ncbi:hypothetical protein [Haliea salexigens]|uniref:hypothetical protein n=1 Tax=Haliea salexigens TaxID=287487 RepID=UPI001182D22E|nr:hypothetical protein [Haliea salexigens]|tara:strand:- start:414 stop:947 length:534 start_codon:yes stop_codon:yes gene_type:complete
MTIEDSKRELLEKRRTEAKCASEKRHRINLIEDTLTVLADRSIDYQLLWDRSAEEWLESELPFMVSGAIDWRRVENKRLINGKVDRCNLSKNLSLLASEANLEMADDITILWSNANRPPISMTLESFLDNAIAIMDEDFDTWVISPPGNWCIEYHHSGSLGLAILTSSKSSQRTRNA